MLVKYIVFLSLGNVPSESKEPAEPVTKAGVCFDVGFNTGQDVRPLLELAEWCQNVVAVEASGLLLSKARKEFDAELQSERLILVQAFLHDNASETFTRAPFFWNKNNNQFNSFLPSTGCRGRFQRPNGEYSASPRNCISEMVSVTSCGSLYRKYGVPAILRLDIEGHEMACVKDLNGTSARPWLVSLEFAQVFDRYGEQMFKILERLGYHSFKRVNSEAVHKIKGRRTPNEMLDCHHLTPQWHRRWHLDTTSGILGPCQRWSELYARYGYPTTQNRTGRWNLSSRLKYTVHQTKRRPPTDFVDLRKGNFKGQLRRRTPGALGNSR
jgi:FkbM family methyltransferase